MKTWRLVSGILSIVFFAVVAFQSCAAGVVIAVGDNTSDTSASAGMLLGVLMLAGGIVSIATKEAKKGGYIATLVLFLLAALFGYANKGVFADLVVWSTWCLICAVVSIIGLVKLKKQSA